MRPKHWIYTIPLRLRSLFHRRQADQELDDELRDHVERKTEEYVTKGFPADEACRQALLEMGGIEKRKEECRDARRVTWFQDLTQDLRFSLRMLRKSPGFTAVAVLTLALGIGANTAIFSVVYAVLLRPLPYPAAERLVWLAESAARSPEISVTWINFQHWRSESNAFENMAGFATADLTMTGRGNAMLTHAGVVTSSFFQMTGASPLQGRLFTEADDRLGAEPTVVVTPEFWQRTLGSDPRAIGTSLDLNGRSYHIIGVLQPGLNFFLRPVDFYLPLGLSAGSAVKRSEHKFNMRVLGLLKPGITLAQARSNLDTIMQRLALSDPGPEDDYRSYAAYLNDKTTGEVRQTLFVLMGAVGLVLVIACANVASLLLVRSAARTREMAIRAAIGAGRARLARQLLTENLVIGTLGGGLGLMLAAWCLHTLVLIGPRSIPRLSEARLDVPVLCFAAGITILVVFLAGVAPAFSAGKVNLIVSLKEGSGAAGAGRRRQMLRGCLVVAEIAITLILVFASGLLLQSLVAAQTSYPGFDAQRLLALELQLPPFHYMTAENWRQYYRQLIESLRSQHGVENVGAVMCPPGTGGCLDSSYSVLEKPAPTHNDVPVAAFNIADTSYFNTMHIRLLAGRFFSEEDQADGQPITVINERLARSWWSDPRLAVGQHLKVGGPYSDGPTLEIVGVAANVSETGLDGSPMPEFYYPFSQHPSPAMVVMIRTSGDPAALISTVRRQLSNLDRNVPIQSLQPVKQYLGASLDRRRFSTLLLGLFAALAVILAVVGIYGVLNYWVSTRQREIAIRLAIGARPSTILRWVGYHAARFAALGILLGVLGDWGASRWLNSMVFGVSARNPAMMVAAGAAVIGIAVAASTLPILRAMRVDPITTLRQE